MKRRCPRWSPEAVARVRHLAAEGNTTTVIAKALGISHSTIRAWAAEAGIKLLSRSEAHVAVWADAAIYARRAPQTRALMSRFDVRANHLAAVKRVRRVAVPSWVPRDFVEDFIDRAVLFGEVAAAGHVRHLKREMELA